MATEITVLDFKLSNTFEEYCTHMKVPKQAMFKEMGVKTFYIGQCKDDPKRAPLCLRGLKMFYMTSSPILRQNR